MHSQLKISSSLEYAIETENGYKTYYRPYDRMVKRIKMFPWIFLITLSLLAIIIAIAIFFTVQFFQQDGDTDTILIMLRNLTKIAEENLQQITKLQHDHENFLRLDELGNNKGIEKILDPDIYEELGLQ